MAGLLEFRASRFGLVDFDRYRRAVRPCTIEADVEKELIVYLEREIGQ